MAAGSLLLALWAAAAAPLPPAPADLVHNEGAVSPEAEARLARRLAEHRDASGRTVMAGLFRSLDGAAARERSESLLKAWGPDLLFAFFQGERAWRVEVGPGLSSTLGSLEATMLVNEAALTWLQAGETEAGVEVAMGALLGRLEGRLPPRRDYPSARESGLEEAVPLVGAAVLLLLMAIMVVTNPGRRYRHARLSGGWEGRGGLDDGISVRGGGARGGW